jgi:hypothetical protein
MREDSLNSGLAPLPTYLVSKEARIMGIIQSGLLEDFCCLQDVDAIGLALFLRVKAR